MTLSLSGVPLLVKLQDSPVVSVSNDIKEKISIYPNPTTGDVFIQGYNLSERSVILRDCLGAVVSNWEQTDHRINIAGLPPGIYFLTLNLNEGSKVFRIIKVA